MPASKTLLNSRIFSYWMNRPTIWICPCYNGWRISESVPRTDSYGFSHDRCFLDAVASRTLESKKTAWWRIPGETILTTWKKKERRMQLWQDAYKNSKQIKSMEKAIKDMRIWAAQEIMKKMFRGGIHAETSGSHGKSGTPQKKDQGCGLPSGRRTFGKDVLHLEGVSKRFGEKATFQEPDHGCPL